MAHNLSRRTLQGARASFAAIDAAGGLYVVTPDADLAAVRNAVVSREVRALEVQSKDLGFLSDLPLEFLWLNVTDPDIGPVNALSELRGLFVDTWRGHLDFQWLPRLEWFAVTEVLPGQLDSLVEYGHDALHHLQIGRYPFEDLTPLRKLPRLANLAITDSYHLASLDGIERLAGLRSLELAICRKLGALAGIAKASGLEHLTLASCNRLDDLRPVAKGPSMRLLDIDMRQPMSLRPLVGHPTLEFLRIVSGRRPDDEIEALLGNAALRYLSVRRRLWMRAGEGWQRIDNIYALQPDEQARHEELHTEIDAICAI